MRYSEALLVRSLDPLDDPVEIFFAESRLAHSDGAQPAEVEEEQFITMLVSFDPDASQRWAARAFAATFITAQCGFRQVPRGHQLDSWLDIFLSERRPASLCIVFSLPEYSTVTSQQVSNLLTGLKAANYHHVQLTVAVSANPVDWEHCNGIDGFVAAENRRKDLVALQVFGMMSALMAPGITYCIDAEDLRPVFGSAAHPAQVASGVFHDDEFKTSAEVILKLETSRSVALMPAAPMRLDAQNVLKRSLEKLTPPNTEFVMVTPYDMQSIPLLMEEVVLVSLLVGGLPYFN